MTSHPYRLLLSLACVAALLAGAANAETVQPVSFSDVTDLPARAPDRVLAYGPHPSQRVLYWGAASTQQSPAPLLILLHGGCWLADYDVAHIYPLAAALSDRGYAVWAPEYRRVGEAGGGWPGTFRDIAAAVDRAGRFDDPEVDAQRPVIIGHSAGGHLALWAAARPAFAKDHSLYTAAPLVPRAVIGLAAITDLERYGAKEGSCRQVVAQLMGGPPAAAPARYREASPHALPLPPAVTLLRGSQDAIVPATQSLRGARLRTLPGAGHFDLIHPDTAAFEALLETLAELVADD